MCLEKCFLRLFSLIFAMGLTIFPLMAQEEAGCDRTVYVEVVALDQPFFFNRLGAAQPNGMIYALKSDVVSLDTQIDENGNDIIEPGVSDNLQPGNVRLRSDKRPRPLVLRANQGDCVEIQLTNLLDPEQPGYLAPAGSKYAPSTGTRYAGFFIAGLNMRDGAQNGGTWTGANASSLAAPDGNPIILKYFAQEEGVFQIYSTPGGQSAQQIISGLYAAINVQPEGAEYYRGQVTHDDMVAATKKAESVMGKTGQTLEPMTDPLGKRMTDESGRAIWNWETLDPVSGEIAKREVIVIDGRLYTPLGQPIIDYQAVYESGNRAGYPILSMTKPYAGKGLIHKRDGHDMVQLVHSDLTAIITGPNAGEFPLSNLSPSFVKNPASPNRRQPYREISVFYHDSQNAVQAFYPFVDPAVTATISAPKDEFGINYGIAGITTEILANRLGVGPQGRADAVDLKYEEFFLASWAVGDPAMIVDIPANTPNEALANPEGGYRVDEQTLANVTGETLIDGTTPALGAGNPSFDPLSGAKATKVYYPDDPSNVYHSYISDHMKFRILNPGPTLAHVHHQHAHQWLHSPNSDDGHYLDSQLISTGATFTLEITYNGSGNRNQTVGDSIFHCHFYPHFASGMWGLWRVHDVFEAGTKLDETGRPYHGTDENGDPIWSRALPDGEIATGSPIPAIVPLPTLGMPIPPARVRLSEDGRRSITEPATIVDGVPVYENPGFPFFIPGVAGHRAPHPPLDFAWQEDDNGNPVLDDNGDKILLDGGLPRHLILDGEVVREFHTVWDFTKDTILTEGEEDAEFCDCPDNSKLTRVEKVVAGGLVAFEIPEEGTGVELAAMADHATRTRRTYLPNGMPGNFTLNGLPPTHGAPYAEPSVRENGNPTGTLRRYQGANIQMDVVFNKVGWHYPQQRFITLWEDVQPTVSRQRPPEPLFFRANSDEIVEYWHTNLVPNYYEMDDFQVRTPTDILGQHIHLVKFDVTASDGAANGFNYEDGTFSPDEVRERILAANFVGGLYGFDETTQFIDWTSQEKLCIQNYESFYPFGPEYGDQDWNGAQTTIQRWDTDPLLNNLGEDRTLRTVFTHDHFGPSTHQQAGLYAGLIVEPENSKWYSSGPIYAGPDASTPQPAGTELGTRVDGGPTTWAAVIETANADDSYREFLFEFQDLALGYTNKSKTETSLPCSDCGDSGQAFYPLFCIGADVSDCNPCTNTTAQITQSMVPSDTSAALEQIFSDLADGTINMDLIEFFARNGITLSSLARVQPLGPIIPNAWAVIDPIQTLDTVDAGEFYLLSALDGTCTSNAGLQVHWLTQHPGWSDVAATINAPNETVPGPQIISNGFGQGAYSINYRNEPTPLRVATADDISGFDSSLMTATTATGSDNDNDMAFVFTSIERELAELNRQPVDIPIDPDQPDGFQYPINPLIPSTLRSDYDPYTPLLAAYQGDNVQVRTLVGAHIAPHSFQIQGVKWFFEPSYTNSGYRNVQGMGISEHFEMMFHIPFSQTTSGNLDGMDKSFTDYMYNASSSNNGVYSGNWGLMRAFVNSQDDIMPLPNNDPSGTAYQMKRDDLLLLWDLVEAEFDLPADERAANFVEKTVVAIDAASVAAEGYLLSNGRGNTTSDPGAQPPTFGTDLIGTPYGLIYMLEEDLPPGESKLPANQMNPLVMRANAGDWIKVTLKNQFDTSNDTFGTSNNVGEFNSQAPFNNMQAIPNNIKLSTSQHAGLHPQLVSFDMGTSNAFNVGYNQTQTAAPGEEKTYYWYAGNIDYTDGAWQITPVETGSANLIPADTVVQAFKGLYGALIIEPEGSTFMPDPFPGEQIATMGGALMNRTSGSVYDADGNFLFREFAAILQDEPFFYKASDSDLAAGTNLSNFFATSTFNYRAEPSSYRYSNLSGDTEMAQTQANSLVNADPQTPVFPAAKGQPVRFRMLYAGTRQLQVTYMPTLIVDGHSWQEEPFQYDSTVIGDNPFSQNLGTQQMVSWEPAQFVIDSAGGAFQSPGDYRYTEYLGWGGIFSNSGGWGLMRVTDGNDAIVINEAQGTAVTGTVTVDPTTGTFVSIVSIVVNGGDAVDAAVNGDGTFSVELGSALADGDTVEVTSSQGGSDEVTAPFPQAFTPTTKSGTGGK